MLEENILKELDKVVSLTGIKKRDGETFTTALIHRLQETKAIGEVGHTREIVISVPKELVDTEAKAQSFVKKAGMISRDPALKLEVKMEPKEIKDIEGNPRVLLDFVFSVTKETNIDAVIQFIAE